MLSARIFVIVPVRGNWEDAVQCLKALESQTIADFQVIVADDGSPEPPPAAIHEFKRTLYLRNPHAGFAVNCNRAASQAIALGATHLLFLNSDTSFDAGFMENWKRRVTEMPDAILSPLIYWSRHPNRIWSSGGKLTVFTAFVRFRKRFDRVTQVDTVTGCAILVPVPAWTALGGFDSKYTMYFEDFDFTLRAKDRGVPTYVLPDRDLRVLHHVSGSFRKDRVWRKHYLMLASSLIFIRSHYRGIRKPICVALNGAHLAMTVILSLPELPNARLLWSALVRGFSE